MHNLVIAAQKAGLCPPDVEVSRVLPDGSKTALVTTVTGKDGHDPNINLARTEILPLNHVLMVDETGERWRMSHYDGVLYVAKA